MSEYGLTPKGPNIKRLDTIIEEINDDLTESWGVNTRQNPQSLLSHLVTNISDRLAELWEFGEHIYHAMYPSSAEGISLDNAAQFGGTVRSGAKKSFYPIHCTGVDGTVLEAGTMIASNTNPATYLSMLTKKEITRSAFNEVAIKVSYAAIGQIYTVIINGTTVSVTSTSSLPDAILSALKTAIDGSLGGSFTTEHTAGTEILHVVSNDRTANNVLTLSENLTTDSVTTIITFGTVEYGDILIPSGAITEIVKADPGLTGVRNVCDYIAGNDEESDAEFRKSYADKIFNRSSMMLESIRSAILENVQGVTSVSMYENSTNAYKKAVYTVTGDEEEEGPYFFAYEGVYFGFDFPEAEAGDTIEFDPVGKELILNDGTEEIEITMTASLTEPESGEDITDDFVFSIPPHSIEAVVSGGDESEIANQILLKKAGGIGTYGDKEVTIAGNYGEDITIRFSRPKDVYVWFKITVTQKPDETLPANYADIIKSVVENNISGFGAGDSVEPLKFISELYASCRGIGYIDIKLAKKESAGETPVAGDYTLRSVEIEDRQIAHTTKDMIGVELDA